MKSQLEVSDDVLGSSVTAGAIDAIRHAVFASAIALPMAMLSALDGFETESGCATAGELWLEVQNKMTVATERLT